MVSCKARHSDQERGCPRLLFSLTTSPQVELANKGGVIVRLESGLLTGFIPLSQLEPSRLPPRGGDASPEAALSSLVGARLSAAVLEVDLLRSSLVLSEKQALLVQALRRLAPGDVRPGRVKRLQEYGAFVELLDADGKPSGAEGLVHISELSWSRLRHPEDVLTTGQEVRVKVLTVEPTGRIALSLRQLAADPLKETLDTILPAEGGEAPSGPRSSALLPGLGAICAALRGAEGVDAVELGRQAQEQKVVSQDLELWMTTDEVQDGYTLVARAGRLVQEVHVRSKLPREAVRRLVVEATKSPAIGRR